MGICVWPILQTINFVLIPEHNRVVYVSICSLAWTSFLAYMKALDAKKIEENKIPNKINTTDKIVVKTSQNDDDNNNNNKKSSSTVKTKKIVN